MVYSALAMCDLARCLQPTRAYSCSLWPLCELCFMEVFVTTQYYGIRLEMVSTVCAFFCFLLVLPLTVSANQAFSKPNNLRFFGTESTPKLSYSEGGDASSFSLGSLDPDLVRFVNSESGSNNNDGKTESSAWQTPSKVTKEIASLLPGTHILFKRGLEYVGSVKIVGALGTEGSRIVLGAYGPLNESPPRLGKIIVNRSQYITVRDLDSLQIRLDDSPSHIIIYNNIVRGDPKLGYPNNGISVLGGASYVTVVGNTVYDIGSNDGIVLHPNMDRKSVGDSHWVIDNLIIGNQGMENGIDLAMSAPEDGDPHIARDVKVVGNRVSMAALAGRSSLSGHGQAAIEANHAGKGIWLVGNIFAGSGGDCIRLDGEKQDVVFSGNVVFSCNHTSGDSPKPSAFIVGTNISVLNNTFLHSGVGREVINLSGAAIRFEKNHLISNRSDSALFFRLDLQNLSVIQEMNGDVYSFSDKASGKLSFEHIYDGSRITAFFSFAEFRDGTGFESNGLSEANAEEGLEPSIDPYGWNEQFLKDIATRYAAKTCSAAGAINCNGDRDGLNLPSLPSVGTGWAGPAIVRERLQQLGMLP